MNQEMEGYIGDELSSRHRHALMTWPALLAIGWLIYEITAQPNLGAAIVCAKFGWNDFRAALWLRKADPHRRRARACFWFYLASGLWKMAITATLTIFAFAFIAASLHQRVQGQPPPRAPFLPPWFYGVVLTALMGFGLSTCTTLIALLLASHYRIKFWLSTSVHRFRRHNLWPPYDAYNTTPNQAGRVLLTALILIIAPATLSLCVTLGLALARFGPIGVMAIVLLAMGICPVTIMVLRDILMMRFVARTPWECWQAVGPGDELSASSDRKARSLITDY